MNLIKIAAKIKDLHQHFQKDCNFNLSYYIGIDKLTDNKLGLPYNNCYNDVTDFDLNKTIINYIKSKNQTYTQVNCLKLCFELEYSKQKIIFILNIQRW